MALIEPAEIAAPIGRADWTEPERWAWGEIAAGRIADFAAGHGRLDPRLRKGWTAKRTLRADFLRAILFEKEWADQVPIAGVRIAGARWSDALELPYARLFWPLCLEACRFEGAVDLSGLRSDTRLSLKQSAFLGGNARPSLSLERCAIGAADLSETSFARNFAATGASFDGLLDLSATRLKALDLKRAKAASLFLRDGSVGAVNLTNGRIDLNLDMSGLAAGGKVDMESITVGQDLILSGSETRASSYREDVILRGGSIGGNINWCGTLVAGALKMNGLEVKKHFFLRPPMGYECRLQKGGARFAGPIDMTFAVIRGHLELTRSRFDAVVNMKSIEIGEDLHAGPETTFRDAFHLDLGQIHGDAYLPAARFKGDATFGGARIDGAFYLSGARFEKALSLADSHIGGNLFIDDGGAGRFACKGPFRLSAATIGGHCQVQGSFLGPVSAWGLQVGANFQVIAQESDEQVVSLFKQAVDLSRAWIKGSLFLNLAQFEGGLSMVGIKVDQELSLGSRFLSEVAQESSAVGAPAALDPSSIADLSAATIGGQLTIDVPKPATAETRTVQLDLRDASSGSLQVADLPAGTCWPEPGSVLLDGFRFDRLGGYGVATADEMASRSPKWFKQWLGLDEPYSPQPYEQLAAVLRQAGDVEKANRVLHAGRERARKAAWSWRKPFENLWGLPRWLGLFLLKVTIGYGIGLRFFYALIWAVALTAVGFWMLGPIPVGARDGVQLTSAAQKIVYSFDQLLPIIELDHGFSNVKLAEPAAAYFWFHRLFGFLLGAFITAGIAGLTQRSRS